MEQLKAFKFCPRCGHKFLRESSYLSCTKCGLEYYINPKPCTCVILKNEKGQYLLVKRAVEPGKGLWDLPGGFAESQENLEDSARRELREELGIKVGEMEYLGSFYSPYLFQDISYDTLVAVFLGSISSSEAMEARDDVESYEFFPPDNLPVEKFAFPNLKKMFALADKAD